MNKIAQKIKKLLALATSDNENEAKAATEKAEELLVKHNLKTADLKEEEEFYDRKSIEKKWATTEDKFVSSILARFFFVTVIKSRKRKAEKTVLILLGKETNVEIAMYAYEFLSRAYIDLFAAYKKETKCPATYRQSYYLGLTEGIAEKLKIKREDVEQSMGLVVVPDEGLKEYVQSQIGNTRPSSQRINMQSAAAKNEGQKAGRSLNINKGVSHNQGNKGKLLK